MTTPYVGNPANTFQHESPTTVTCPDDTEINSVASLRLITDYLTDRVAFLQDKALLRDGSPDTITGTVDVDGASARLKIKNGARLSLEGLGDFFDIFVDSIVYFDATMQFDFNSKFVDLINASEAKFVGGAWHNDFGFEAQTSQFPSPELSAYYYDAPRSFGKLVPACEFQCEQNNGTTADGVFVSAVGTGTSGYWLADLLLPYNVASSIRLPMGANASATQLLLENLSGGALNVQVDIDKITLNPTPSAGNEWTRTSLCSQVVNVPGSTVAWFNLSVATSSPTADENIVIQVTMPNGANIKFYGAQFTLGYSGLNPEV